MNNAFWREDSVYPFVHAVIPAALYFATRNATLSLLLMYVWETLELTLALLVSSSTFGESAADALIGDPLVGALGIGALALADVAFGWAPLVRATAPLWLRLLASAYIAVLSLGFFFLSAQQVDSFSSPLIAAYGVAIVVIGALMYVTALRTAEFVEPLAWWLGLVALLALAGALPGPSSVYIRVVFVNGVAFLVGLILVALKKLRVGSRRTPVKISRYFTAKALQ